MNSLPPSQPAAPQAAPNSGRWTWELLVVGAIAAAYTVNWAVKNGKAVGWDQRNYQFYGAYALLSGRLDHDLGPGGMQTWLNPLVYVPQYWLINHLPAMEAASVFAAVQALNGVLVYALARLVFRNAARWLATGIALLAAVTGMSDPYLFSQLGGAESDYYVSLPVLAALCSLCWAIGAESAVWRQVLAYALAGFLLGVAAGLKWTCFVYVVGMTLALLILWPKLRLDGRRFLSYAAGGVLGFLPAGGLWSWHLWRQYRNPTFPFWNDLFRSPWHIPWDFRDVRFLPSSAEQAISYPFQWLIGLHPSSETPFRDARFAILAVLVPVVLAAGLGKWTGRFRGRSEEPERSLLAVSRAHLWLLLTSAVISYLVWIRLFGIQRYLSPITLLGGLLLLVALDLLLTERGSKLAAWVLLCSFSLYWMQTEPKDWRVPYGSDWFGVQLISEVEAPDTLFVMLGAGPMGYIVPFLPSTSRTVRLSETNPAAEPETESFRHARAIISDHSGPIRSLAVEPLREIDYDHLNRFGLSLDLERCRQFRSDTDRFTTCPMTRQTVGESSPTTPQGG
jgi:hypothetical protein